jgi:hypothetical protein
MQDIKVDEALWASSMLPEGIVERWFIADGAIVAAGDPMAEIRIEDALHEIWGTWIRTRINGVRVAILQPHVIKKAAGLRISR